MTVTGRCYCGELQYEARGEPVFRGFCHCRECQYISGGNANVAIAMPSDGFSFTRGEPAIHQRTDLDNPVSRLFCGTCGTHILSRSPVASGVEIIKAGTLDDLSVMDHLDTAIWMSEAQPFHHVPDQIPASARFEKFVPGDQGLDEH